MRVYGTGHPIGPQCSITETATVLCSKHECKDEQLLTTLPSKLVKFPATDADKVGAPLSVFQTKKLNQSKGSPAETFKI